MNFVKRRFSAAQEGPGLAGACAVILLSCLILGLSGCGDGIRLPTAEQMAEFNSAGPVKPKVDLERLVEAKIRGRAYTVLPGEVLELTMPAILQVVTVDQAEMPTTGIAPFVCRISESGTINLPVVGEIEVAGKTLAQIEAAVVQAYYPEYTVTRPSVYAKILEYEEARVSITGAVMEPGVYSLRHDSMSLVSLLMEAGGIVEDGAGAIRIIRDGGPDTSEQQAASADESDSTAQTAASDDLRHMVELPLPHVTPAETADIDLEFELHSVESTEGELFFEYEDVCIKIDSFDIASVEQREALVERLVQEDAELARAVDKQIKDLARVLNGDTDKPHGLEEIPIEPEMLALKSDETGSQMETAPADDGRSTIVLPVEGLNTPFVDVALQDGDTVIVERLEQPLFTVLGLVNESGNFPYPSHADYNLMQALGFAGGLDPSAEPRYATIYRLKPNGEVVHASFEIIREKKGAKLTDSLSTPIKPGDIIAVEHTPRTRTNVFLERVFRINLGVYAPLYNLNNN